MEVGDSSLKTFSFDYKDEKSKLVRFDLTGKIVGNSLFVKSLSITGDFFAFPPEIISDFEEYFSGRTIECSDLTYVSDALKLLVDKRKALLIGIRIDIVVKALSYFCEKFKNLS